MKTTVIAIILALALFALFADTSAFTYQACLRDEKGEIIKDGGGNVKQNHTVELRLYNAATGGTALWGRKYNVMTDETGVFNLAVSDDEGSSLGDAQAGATLASVFKKVAAGDLFVGLTVVGSAAEIVPRQRVFAAPFAAMANDVRAVSGDITVGGNITLAGENASTVITRDGIVQNGGESTLQTLGVNGNATITGNLAAGALTANSDGVTVKGAPLNVQNTQLKIDGVEVVPVPVGGVIMWTRDTLPDDIHWAVCDGANGTPDLRERFVVGVGAAYTLGAKGGEATHKLTEEEMPKHSHDYKFTGADLNASWKDHNYFYCQENHYGDHKNTKTTESAGGDKAHENRPPYYALYYIMRIK